MIARGLARLSLAAPALWLALSLPARGDAGSAEPLLTPRVRNQLSAIDTLPSLNVLSDQSALRNAAPSLSSIASDSGNDVGVRIRAARAMVGYCNANTDPDDNCASLTSQIHVALLEIITSYQSNPSPTPRDLVLMRAAVESLGAARAVLPDDVATLLRLLDHPSRDVRATAVRALATSCAQDAIDRVRALQRTEPTAQVRGELNLAAQAITDNCTTPPITPSKGN
ncbi:MAG TPA: HEAT repeat domain-containing protein [Kofleriaceae bacterium]|nr:HEAT repeat domain-containing protein [Kofleriaceae bacterium]